MYMHGVASSYTNHRGSITFCLRTGTLSTMMPLGLNMKPPLAMYVRLAHHALHPLMRHFCMMLQIEKLKLWIICIQGDNKFVQHVQLHKLYSRLYSCHIYGSRPSVLAWLTLKQLPNTLIEHLHLEHYRRAGLCWRPGGFGAKYRVKYRVQSSPVQSSPVWVQVII